MNTDKHAELSPPHHDLQCLPTRRPPNSERTTSRVTFMFLSCLGARGVVSWKLVRVAEKEAILLKNPFSMVSSTLSSFSFLPFYGFPRPGHQSCPHPSPSHPLPKQTVGVIWGKWSHLFSFPFSSFSLSPFIPLSVSNGRPRRHLRMRKQEQLRSTE